MEQALLRQWEKIGKVPARAGTTAVVKKTAGGDSYGGVGLLGRGEGKGGGEAPAGASTAAAVRK